MSFLEKLKTELSKKARVEKRVKLSLTKGVGIEKNFEEKPKSNPNFIAKSLEEPGQPKEKLRKTKKLKAFDKSILYPEQDRRVKVKEKFSKSKPKIQETIEEGKVKKESWFEAEGQLAVDVYQTEKELVILSAIAGVKPEDINISGQGDVVIIRGRRERPVKDKEENYFYQECYWGPFSKEIILPVEADASRATAAMTEGVLIIRIPKIERKKEKKIIVKEDKSSSSATESRLRDEGGK